MNRFDVSIIIPVFNRVEYTAACLESLAAHAPKSLSFELVVVDNASSDETPALLSRLAGDVVIERNEENLGFAKACNQGARRASGRILVFLNNDTEVHPGWLEPLVEELDAHPNTAAVGSRLLYPDGRIQHAGVAIGRDQIPFHVHSQMDADDPRVTERRAFEIVTAACVAIRRADFLAIGLFDEGFINGHEDIDLCLRFRAAGRDVIYRPDSVVTHHESVSEGRLDKRPHNVARTFAKWRERLVQDDYRYAFPEHERPLLERPLAVALKIGVPDRTLDNWGDIYFAECLAKAICRAGHHCEIHYLNEWGQDDRHIDVAIHIKGLSRYVLKPYHVNLMWMINHPELHEDDELEAYDAVFVASSMWAETLRGRIETPVFFLPQATDPEHFQPASDREKKFDLVFVGNNAGKSRGDMRPIVRDLLPTRHTLAVWGQGWEDRLPPGVWRGRFVPWKDLPSVYAQARIVLNDHHLTMKEHGFINNRTYDALACNASVVSDAVPGLEALPRAVTYRDAADLRKIVDTLLANDAGTDARQEILAEHSFDHRAQQLLEAASALWRGREHPAVEIVDAPRVSVLMATYDRPEFLPDAIASVRAQSYPHWELVLVNDGGASVRELVDGHRDERIRLVELDENRGKGHAMNVAFDTSRGDFIAYLDDDDTFYPEHLERLLLPLTVIPGIRFAYGDTVWIEHEANRDGTFRETSREVKYPRQTSFDAMVLQNFIPGIAVVHDRALFEEAGRFDPELPVLIDWDMWRRMTSLTYPYHVYGVTSAAHRRVQRDGERTTVGSGHLTHTQRSRWIDARLRVLNKPLPGAPEVHRSEWVEHEQKLARYWQAVYAGDDALQAGDPRTALAKWERAHRALPSQFPAAQRIARHALQHGELQKALNIYRECVRLGSPELSDYLFACLAALKLGRPQVVLEVAQVMESRKIELDPRAQAMVQQYVERARAMAA